MLKNKSFAILLTSCIIFFSGISIPVYSEPADAAAEIKASTIDSSVDEALNNTVTEEVVTPHVEDIQEMTPNANEKLRNEVVNDTDSHLKGVVKKFLAVMLGVAISSILIFFILTLMNKMDFLKDIKEKANSKEKDEPEDIPISNDENDALRIFLDKTK